MIVVETVSTFQNKLRSQETMVVQGYCCQRLRAERRVLRRDPMIALALSSDGVLSSERIATVICSDGALLGGDMPKFLRDTNGDSLPEFVDGWGRPLDFRCDDRGNSGCIRVLVVSRGGNGTLGDSDDIVAELPLGTTR